MSWRCGVVALAVSLVPGAPTGAADAAWDVVVYGGTSAGVTAAVQASRMGRKVVLVAPEQHLGGMSSSGLGAADAGDTSLLGGLARAVYERLTQHYDSAEAWRFGTREGLVAQKAPLRAFEPRVAGRVFEDLVREAHVEVVRKERLDRRGGVRTKGGRIESIRTVAGRTYRARVFVDASYEGDLMAAAGVSYHVGREGREVYGERWNGVQNEARHRPTFFPPRIDPFVERGNRSAGLLPGVSLERPGLTGSGDNRIQAYSYRPCLTNVPENRVPFSRPEGYDPSRYELALRLLASGWRETMGDLEAMPNGKFAIGTGGPFGMDFVAESWSWPDASDEERDTIASEHERYQRGLLFFLATEARVPADVRAIVERYGLARDEFKENRNWPHQIDVREARRMRGEYVLTEADALGERSAPDPVGLAWGAVGSHHVQRYVTVTGFVQNEGDVAVAPPRPYGVPLGALLPRRSECTNLVVPVALSASHTAYGSVRREPQLLVLGQSAATVAVLALESGVPVQDVDRQRLRARLVSDGQILEPPR